MNIPNRAGTDVQVTNPSAKPARKRKPRTQIEEVWLVGEVGKAPTFAFLTEEAAQQFRSAVLKFQGAEADTVYLSLAQVWKA